MSNKTKSKVKTFEVVACGALLAGLALTGCKSDQPPPPRRPSRRNSPFSARRP